jgi:hypothetical protein
MGRELYGEMKEEEEGGHAGFGVGPNSHACGNKMMRRDEGRK